MPQKEPIATGTILNNRYRIATLLGQGGFGAVYRAWDLNLNRVCAVKENIETSRDAVRQFSREATLLANLTHPNLPRVIDHFSITGQGQYLVMDYIDGKDLREMMEQTFEPLPEAQVLPWIIQICDALKYLHSQPQPIIHRDLKPANIRITPQGKAMLVDFGIAKVYDPDLRTISGAKALSPGYSPPEQYGQGVTDIRSDIYALGATLYALLTGQKPPESIDLLTGTAPPLVPPRTLVPKISPSISAAIVKAMQLERSQRFQNISELKAALIEPGSSNKQGNNLLRVGLSAFILLAVLLLFIFLGRSCTPFTPTEDMTEIGLTVRPVDTVAAEYQTLIAANPTPSAAKPSWTHTVAIEPPLTTPEITSESKPTQAFLIYVREGPGEVFNRIGGIRNETRYKVTGRNQESDWLYVQISGGVEGWVSAGMLVYYAGFNEDITRLPLIKSPPTPMKEPTEKPTP